jgi:hypothetical protein
MRRYVISDVYWFLSKPTAKLRDIRNRYVIKGPQGIFIDCSGALLKSDLYAVCKEIVLPN